LEEDLDVEARVKAEQQKAIKKNDRKLKELLAQADEDRRNLEKLQDTSERQNKKLTQLRRRAEEAVCLLCVEHIYPFSELQHLSLIQGYYRRNYHWIAQSIL
jgi:hypothetical protein